MLIRKEALDAAGHFTEDYFFSFEDLDFCLRARAHGYRTACVGTATVEHRGAHSIGAGSPRRLYFAARNHLLLAQRAAPLGVAGTVARAGAIVSLNLAHALFRSPAPRLAGVTAVARGVRDHLLGRYGPDSV
jgi:GT2 family glycosyltransferase